jgi:23S rRNA-/tRNA-specific pseudouridylate synthase
MPVVGDTVYRAPPGVRTSKPAAVAQSPAAPKTPDQRPDISPASAGPLRLAAVRLVLDHPRTGKRMTFQIDPPQWLRFK